MVYKVAPAARGPVLVRRYVAAVVLAVVTAVAVFLAVQSPSVGATQKLSGENGPAAVSAPYDLNKHDLLPHGSKSGGPGGCQSKFANEVGALVDCVAQDSAVCSHSSACCIDGKGILECESASPGDKLLSNIDLE